MTDRLTAELAGRNLHRRTPEMVADLFIGGEEFVDFAVRKGVIDEATAARYKVILLDGLKGGAAQQAQHTTAIDPLKRFFEILRSAISQGRAIIASAKDGSPPSGQEMACGWIGVRNLEGTTWHKPPNATEVAWVKKDDLFLDLDAAYPIVQDLGRRGAGAMPFEQKTLSRRLNNCKMLKATESDERNEVYRVIKKNRMRVLVLDPSLLVDASTPDSDLDADDDNSGHETPTGTV